MKAKILTTVPIKEAWLDEIRQHMPDIEFEIHSTKKKLKMYYNSHMKSMYGNFNHLRELLDAPTGYRYRVYVMSEKERKAYGITDHLAAYDNVDKDGVLDFYLAVSNVNIKKARENGFKYNFTRIFVHECLHGKEQEIGREYLSQTAPDRTHDWEAQGRLKDLLTEHFKWEELSLKVKLLTIIRDLMIKYNLMKTAIEEDVLLHPVPVAYRKMISQGYGVKDSRYPKTGRHIGIDYAIPVGTPLIAPAKSVVVTSGNHPLLGYYCHLAYEHGGQQWQERWCHLREAPAMGSYFKGGVVAYSGNTGDSTGPHLHREKWRDVVRVDLINKTNWGQLTVYPELN